MLLSVSLHGSNQAGHGQGIIDFAGTRESVSRGKLVQTIREGRVHVNNVDGSTNLIHHAPHAREERIVLVRQ